MPPKKAKQKYYNEAGKEISYNQWKQNDENLTKSISGYPGYKSMYDQQKEEKARNLSSEAARLQRIKQNPAADNTRVVKKVKLRTGGTALKPVPSDKQKSLGQLPTPVRNKMGYKKSGGPVKMKMGGCTPKSLRKSK
jgi:hypothetical protein